MVRREAETFEPVTISHSRGHGCRDLLVYCNSGRCHHSATMNADWLSDETPVRSLCRRMVCTKCSMIGADVRPDWSSHVKRSGPVLGCDRHHAAGARTPPSDGNPHTGG